MEASNDKFSALACLKETQGERVLRALKKLYEKMNKLEDTTERRRNRVQSLEGRIDHPSAEDFCRRLAKAEAQCKLLEEQLSYMRKFIVQSSIDESLQETSSKLQHGAFPLPQDVVNNNNSPNVDQNFSTSSTITDGTIREFLPCSSSSNLKELLNTNVNERYVLNDMDLQAMLQTHQKLCKTFKPDTKRNHHKIRVTEMPFVSATTTAKSHSLRANIQTLHSMVKYCNPVLCSAAPLHRKRSSSAERQSQGIGSHPRTRRSNSMSDISKLFTTAVYDSKAKQCNCDKSAYQLKRTNLERSRHVRKTSVDESNREGTCKATGGIRPKYNDRNADRFQRAMLLRNLQKFHIFLNQNT